MGKEDRKRKINIREYISDYKRLRHWLVLGALLMGSLALEKLDVMAKGEGASFSYIEAMAVFVASMGVYVATVLTMKIQNFEAVNRKKDEKEAAFNKMQSQVASFPQFRVEKCILYNLDKVEKIKKECESRRIYREARRYRLQDLRSYLLIIYCKESFPAYYKINIKKVKMSLQETKQYVCELTFEQCVCWITNNQNLTIWINFEDDGCFINQLWKDSALPLPSERSYLEVDLDFNCTNTLLERPKEADLPLYRVHIEYSINKMDQSDNVELRTEHRYIERINNTKEGNK